MERYPKPNVMVGGSILSHEISSLLGKRTSKVATHLLCSIYIYIYGTKEVCGHLASSFAK